MIPMAWRCARHNWCEARIEVVKVMPLFQNSYLSIYLYFLCQSKESGILITINEQSSFYKCSLTHIHLPYHQISLVPVCIIYWGDRGSNLTQAYNANGIFLATNICCLRNVKQSIDFLNLTRINYRFSDLYLKQTKYTQ